MSETTQGEAKSGWSRRWPLIKKILTYVFFALVAGLLIGLARNLDWPEVYNTLRNYQAKTLWMAGAAAFGSYVVYCFSMCWVNAMRATTCRSGRSFR